MTAAITRASLERIGFSGFQTVRVLLESRSAAVPTSPGVYAVVRDGPRSPQLLERSVGGWYKGKDPTVSVATLAGRWVTDSDVLYIGRAQSSLRGRVKALVRYGTGEPVAHQGGRYLWQVGGSEQFLVSWLSTRDPVEMEIMLQSEFANAHGKLPFANLRVG